MRHFLNSFTYLSINLEAGELFENFFISAITAILGIRGFLIITGYPQLGGGKYHIAHMLWGGMLMTIAIGMMMLFLNREVKHIGAIIGGVGFGTFIDELGKFITHDNNYFYQPTIALIYIIFVSLFLCVRFIEHYVQVSTKDYAINALEVAKEVVLYDLDAGEKKQALEYLKNADPYNPIVKTLKTMLHSLTPQVDHEIGFVSRCKQIFLDYYKKMIENKHFAQILVIMFVGYTGVNLVKLIHYSMFGYGFAQWGQFISSSISGVFVVLGLFLLIQRKRLIAYLFLKRSILISIYLTQFFIFYIEQLSAIVGLFSHITILMAIQFLIYQETSLQRK
ncbi:hypothetical protein ACFL1P_00760 [Patescibacteria group bacterium]